jgi:hypothetical protein
LELRTLGLSRPAAERERCDAAGDENDRVDDHGFPFAVALTSSSVSTARREEPGLVELGTCM